MNNIEKAIHILKEELADGTDSYLTFATAIAALEKQLTNGWIPVSERLPDISKRPQRILATLKNEIVLELWYINDAFKFNDINEGGGMEKVSEHNPVIAWQPLPEPYKGVSE